MATDRNENRLASPILLLIIIGLAGMFIASFVYRFSNPSLEEEIFLTSSADQPSGFGGGESGGMGGLSAEAMTQVSQLMAELQKHPDSYNTRMQLAAVFIEVRNWDGAAAHLKKAMELEPRESAPVYMLGVSLYNIGDFEGSAKCFEKVLKLENEPLAKFNLALIYRQHLGKVAESDAMLKEIADTESLDPALREQAKKVLEASISNRPAQ